MRGGNQDCCPIPPFNDPGVVCDSGFTKVLGLIWTPVDKLLSGNFNNSNWASLVDLTSIDMSNQNLSGTLYAFSINSKLKYVQIQGNSIGGSISLFSNSLINVDYSDNLITGTIPTNFPSSMKSINFNNNLLSGSIPLNLGSLTSADVGNNKMVGAIPSFPTSMISFVANNNSLTGPIISFNNVRSLDVSFNQLSGTFPAVPTGFTLLKLQNNQFTSVGALGAAMTTHSCDISNNLFYSWSAPSWVGICLMNNLLTSATVTSKSTGSISESIGILDHYRSLEFQSKLSATEGAVTQTNLVLVTFIATKFHLNYTIVHVVMIVVRVLINLSLIGVVIAKSPFKREWHTKMSRKKVSSDDFLK